MLPMKLASVRGSLRCSFFFFPVSTGSCGLRAMASCLIAWWNNIGSCRFWMSSMYAVHGRDQFDCDATESAHTHERGLRNLNSFFSAERCGQGLFVSGDEILWWPIRDTAPEKQSHCTLPARRSSFSLPLIFVAKITSPVPIEPYLPLRSTRARAVVGLWPSASLFE